MVEPSRKKRATVTEIRETVGDLDAARLVAILASGATRAELAEALAWAAGETVERAAGSPFRS
jgi:hypothetical protein